MKVTRMTFTDTGVDVCVHALNPFPVLVEESEMIRIQNTPTINQIAGVG